MDIAGAVAAMRLGRVEFRAEKNAIVHASVGKVSFEPEHLEQNIAAFMNAGSFISCHLSQLCSKLHISKILKLRRGRPDTCPLRSSV